MFHKLIVLVYIALALGCGGSADTNSAASGNAVTTVSGANLSGSYTLTRMDCYNGGGPGVLNVTTLFTGGSAASTMVINGNSMTRVFNSTCTLTESGTIVFDGVNSYTLKNRTYTSSSGANCANNYTTVNVNLTPGSFTVQGSHLTTLTDLTDYYASTATSVSFKTTLQVNGSPLGWCYNVYTK